jgi:hypothetical protein
VSRSIANGWNPLLKFENFCGGFTALWKSFGGELEVFQKMAGKAPNVSSSQNSEIIEILELHPYKA